MTAVAELIGRAQQGDTDAYGEIYRQHRAGVFRYVYLRVDRQAHTAEDITQETFLRAWRRIGTWQDRGKGMHSWLLTIAQHLVIDLSRTSWARNVKRFDDVSDLSEEADRAAVDDPADLVIEAITAADLRTALACLSPKERQTVELYHLRQLSLAETAAVMGGTELSAKARVHRARRRLRSHLERKTT